MYLRRLTRALQATIALALIWPAVAAADAPNADLDHDKVMDNLESHIASLPDDAEVKLIVSLDRTATSSQVRALERKVGNLQVTRRFQVVDAVALTATKDQVRDLAAQGVVDQVEQNLPVHSVEEDAPFNAFNESAQASFGVTEARLDDPLVEGDGDDDLAAYSPDDLVAAVIDTGIDANHVDLNGGKVLSFVDCSGGSGCAAVTALDDNGHGTHVAATIAGDGNGDARFRGVAPGAALVGVKVLDENGDGSTLTVMDGIQWVVEHKDEYGIEAINLSLGTPGCSDGLGADSLAVNVAWSEGLVVLAAAGNNGPANCTIGSPGAAKYALTVGSMADLGALGFKQAHSSSRGPTADGRTKPDISAPGVGITSAAAGTGSGYVSMSGTSMATPFVTGVALLMMDANASYTNDLVKEKIRSTAIDWGRGGTNVTRGTTGFDDDYGAGRLDAYAALAAADPGLLTSPPRLPNHQLRQGALSGTGQVLEYTLAVAETTFPVAATLFDIPTTCRSPKSDPDFDMRLTAPNGAVVASAASSARQDELGYRPTSTGIYRLRVYSYSDCGDFFMDVSGGSVSSSATSNPDAPKAPAGGSTVVPTVTQQGVTAAALVNAARITARRAGARLRRVGLRRLLRRGRLTFAALSPAAGRLDLAVRMKVRGKHVLIARATRRVTAAGQPRMKVRLTRAGRRLLARPRSVRLRVRAAMTDATSRRRIAEVAVRVRR